MATLVQRVVNSITRMLHENPLYEFLVLVAQALSGSGTDLAPYLTIRKTSARRLIDMTAAEIGGLRSGARVWVDSVKSFFVWDPASTVAIVIGVNDVVFCNPTANGANPGRWIRDETPWPGWVYQTTWLMGDADVANTDDENSGLPGAPLRTSEERQRRLGPTAQLLGQTAYHFRYGADGFGDIFREKLGPNTTPYIHGPTDRAGSAILASGTITAVTTQNPTASPGVAWAITAVFNGGRTDWSGLSGFRIRLTSGAHIHAISYLEVQDGGIPSKTTTDDWLRPVASFNVAPFVQPSIVDEGPAPGDTFVVEALTSVTILEIAFQYDETFFSLPAVVVESLDTSVATGAGQLTFDTTCAVYVDGCKYFAAGKLSTHYSHSSVRSGMSDRSFKRVYGGHFGTLNFPVAVDVSGGAIIDRITFQEGVTGRLRVYGCGAAEQASSSFLRIGMFWTSNTVMIFVNTNTQRASPVGFVLYGNVTATTRIFRIESNWCLTIDPGLAALPLNTPPLTTPIEFGLSPLGGGRTTAPAYDVVAAAYIAPERALTFANIDAAVGAGGFGYNVNDPVTGCIISRHA